MALPPPLLPRSSCICRGVTKVTPYKSVENIPDASTAPSATAQHSLLRAHTRAGRMQPARQVFEAMPPRDRSLVAWTAIMSGYATHGPASEALVLLLRMMERSLRPDGFVFSVVLRACAAVGNLRFGRQVHCAAAKMGYVDSDLFVANGLLTIIGCDAFTLSVALRAASSLANRSLGHQLHCCIIKSGFSKSGFLENCLIEFYGKSRELQLMQKVFDDMHDKDLVSSNSIIQCYADNMCDDQALSHFRAMMFECSECDEFTLGSILHVVTRRGAFGYGREIHGYLIRAGLDSDKHVMSALMDMYVNWATLHKGQCMLPLRMLRYYLLVQGKLDHFIVATSLRLCAFDQDLATGRMLHAYVLKFNMNSDPFVTSSLVDMYAKCGSVDESHVLFSRTKDPGTAAWTAVISGNCLNGQFERAMHLFRRMQLELVQPNEFTYTSVLTACVALGDVVGGMEIQGNSIRTGYGTNASVVKSLISFYLREGQFKQALKLCLSLSNREISWEALVKDFAQGGDHVGVLNLLCVIQRSGGVLDYPTALHILNSCGKLELLHEGLQAHAYLTKRGLASEPCISNHLIDMYSNCGSLKNALDAFRYMSDKSASTWTSIIIAHLENGCPETAIDLFVQMLRREKIPTSIAFLSVLKACAEIGLVSEAFQFFVSMTEVYKIEPSEGHYKHMIEVLGHSGMFKEAEHFIDSVVPSESSASAWILLCSAAKQNGNTKTMKLAMDKLASLAPCDCRANASLGNVIPITD
ncbi:unnamed protein product [Triticum turgidum subsp. durum]|uniref:Pentatricopeptide repeat-containing protein n=1 Tax=Triticum turgidum subsp. durum TaxID=4567 RepID=A0A9R1B1M4_TRITD|nr:unnamed protein product [Triticum turgidum subsp. durum]